MKSYRTKVGLELIGFLILVFAFVVITARDWAVLFALLPLALLIALMLYGIRYILNGNILTVHNSFLPKTRIDVATIRKVKETNNPLSSPAGSLDRVEIFYNKFDSIIISPVRTEEFLRDLLAINPEIEVICRTKRNIFSKLAV